MKRNQKGFTIVEMLVAAALLGGLAVAGMNFFKNNLKAQKTIESNYEVTAIVNEIRGILSNPNNCAQTFAPRNPSSGTITTIKREVNGSFVDSFTVNQALMGGIKISSYAMSRSNPSLASDEFILEVEFSRGKATINDQIKRMIKINYAPAAGTSVVTCHSAVSGLSSLWKISAVDTDDIFYPLGDVGIGTNDPGSPLAVVNSEFPAKPATARFYQGWIDGWMYSDLPNTSSGLTLGRGRGNYSARNTSQVGDTLGVLQFAGTRPDGNGTPALTMMATQTGPQGSTHTPSSLAWFTNADGENMLERMRLTAQGFLGIGTASPNMNLSVNNHFGVNSDGDVHVTGGTDNMWGFYKNGAGRIAINSDESIELFSPTRIHGEVKVGNTGLPCDATSEGSQRYNSTSRKMEFCNGTSWQEFGGGGGNVVVDVLNFPGNGASSWTTLGCYHACSLAHTHDCNNCGWDVLADGSGVCPTGQRSWRARSSRVGTSGIATCFRIE